MKYKIKDFDDKFPDGVFATPNAEHVRVKIRAMSDYCNEKEMSPKDLTKEEMELFLVRKETHYEVITNGNYTTPDQFDSYEEAKQHYNECKEWFRDGEIKLLKVTTEELESEIIADE